MHATLQAPVYSPTNARPCVRWYALLVQAGSERKACQWLSKRLLRPYWPRYRAEPTRYFARREKIIWRSVVPGYIFLPVPIEQTIDCRVVEEAPAVRRVMRDGGGNVVEIPETGREGIEQIRAIEAALNASVIAARDGLPFQVGQRVLISRLEIEGKIRKLDGRQRIMIEAPMFGSKSVTFCVSVGDIESV